MIFIADCADIVALAREQSHEFVLRAVRVLIFVDQQILEAALVILAHFDDGLQQARGFEQQIVEVESVGLAQFFAIFLEQVGNFFGFRIGRLQVSSCGSSM